MPKTDFEAEKGEIYLTAISSQFEPKSEIDWLPKSRSIMARIRSTIGLVTDSKAEIDMAAPDMEVIKEIPGYKVILKAVLKSQIQQLVEQLASHTDEETVVLTASISDGTLSHLGSASGKSFLEDHEEMKSQFLGFCLKRHHKKSQEQTFKQLEMQSPGLQDPSSIGYAPHLPPGNQMGTTRMGIGTENRQRGLRHEPYRRSRGQGHRQHSNRRPPAPNDKLTNSSMSLPISETPERSSIKTEPESVENESSNQSFGEIGADSSVHHSSHPQQANASTTDSMDIPTGDSNSTPLTDGQSMHLDLSGLVPNTDQASEQNSSALSDTSVSVKQESGVDSDLDLQITGTEPGRSTVPRDNWGANVSMSDISMDMNYDPSGATGSSHDMQAGQHGYKAEMFVCQTCGKTFSFRSSLYRHIRSHKNQGLYYCCGKAFQDSDHLRRHKASRHNGPKEHVCTTCEKRFATSYQLKSHHHGEQKDYLLLCDMCEKKFPTQYSLQEHLASHSSEKQYRCECGKLFKQRSSLSRHKRNHKME